MLVDMNKAFSKPIKDLWIKGGMNFYDTERHGRGHTKTHNQLTETFWTMQDIGMVYIVNVGANFYKIGMTTDIQKRFKQFRPTNPFVVNANQVVALIEPWRYTDYRWTNDSRRLEEFIHSLFKDKRHRNTEMFCLEETDFKMLYNKMKENTELPLARSMGICNGEKHRIVRAILPRAITKHMLRAYGVKPSESRLRHKNRPHPRFEAIGSKNDLTLGAE